MGWFSLALLLTTLCANILVQARNVTIAANSRPEWSGTTVEDLWNEYYNIFPTRNRNAAAFRWSSFILDRSWQMDASTFEHLASGYCAVAAAIVKPQQRTRYRLQLPMIGGGVKRGLMYYCCWPCICDTLDFLKVDTKTVQLKGGTSRSYQFVVMGNPCKNPVAMTAPYTDPFNGQMTTMSEQAPEVKCDVDGSLQGARMSDNGYIIMAMFFEDLGQPSMEQSYFEGFADSPCAKRAAGGYQSGMGLVFRKVAGASPISNFVAAPPPTRNQTSSNAFRAASLGSAAVRDAEDAMTCPNGQSGVARPFMKRLAKISLMQLLKS